MAVSTFRGGRSSFTDLRSPSTYVTLRGVNIPRQALSIDHVRAFGAAPMQLGLPKRVPAQRCDKLRARDSYPMRPAGGTTDVSVAQYLGRGPYVNTQLPPISFGVGQGKAGALECTMRVTLPQGGESQRWPLVVFSSGFLLHSSLYSSYAADLASWGLAVVLYDLPEVVDDTVMVTTIGSILDVCTSDARVSPYIDFRTVLLAGHSRGAKVSVLTAAGDPRVRGVALLDPVDVTAMTPMGPGYPSALPAMRVACGTPRRMPALVVGAGRNADVIPIDANYKRFMSSCPGACWSLELLGAGHLQFLDMRVDLFSAFVESGPTPDAVVRRASKAAMVAWARELAVPLARGESLSGRQVLERLQQTTKAIEKETPVSYAFKGLDFLGGSSASGSSASRTGSSGPEASPIPGGGGTGQRADTGAAQASSFSTSFSTSTSSGPSAGASGGASAGSGSASRGGGKWSYDALIQMRAKELKAILVDKGVPCSDCYEKADLARRIMERC